MADGDLIFSRDEDGVSFSPRVMQGAPVPEQGQKHDLNIATLMNQSSLDAVSDMITENIAFDEEGQEGVNDIVEEIYDLYAMGPEAEGDTDDSYQDTSSHDLMKTAHLRFMSKALSAMLPSDDMAIRTEPAIDFLQIRDEKKREEMQAQVTEAEERVREFYTDYLFHELPSYEEDTDQILHQMGLLGCGLRKIVVDRSRQVTPVMPELVDQGSLIVSYDTKNFRVGRYTHKIDMKTGDLIRRIRSGIYRPVRMTDQGEPDISAIMRASDKIYGYNGGLQATGTHRVYEAYMDLFLEHDPHPQGYPRPYIVTIHNETREILAIQRNWDAADPDERWLEHFVAYLYHPGKNAVSGVGLGQILMQTTRALRKAQRRGLEAAYLQNHPSGFKLSNLNIRESDTTIRYGEFVDVDAPTGDIHQAIMLHPFQGPSPGLMTLAEKMEERGRELGGIASIDFSQLMKAGIAAGPAMAAFEESTEFQTAVHRRLYKAHRKELEIIHDRMRIVRGNQVIQFGSNKTLHPQDLQMVNILPYMRPGQASKQKVIMEAHAVWDAAKESPDLLNKRKAAEQYLRALGSPAIDDLLIPDPEEEEIQPMDPLTEYSMTLAGKPIRAGMHQNHQAHIDTHVAQLKMLQVSGLPVEQGDLVSSVLSSHIAEHMGMQVMVEAAAIAGIPLEQIGPQMPPEMEVQLAPAIAQAVMQLEQMRRPPEPGGDKVATESIKAAAASERENIKAGVKQLELQSKSKDEEMKRRHEREMAELQHQHDLELQGRKDDAAMDREVEDNAAALQVAKIRGGSKNAGTRADANA